ncbi:MAG: hypothetical protein GF329_01650 [Candidatus Lokiarchaeota archaeon]|nr:hypothetical protein [Candidatus Lokiarchaeota archaeon]
MVVQSLVLLGYPESIPKPTPRLDLGKIAYLNEWKNPISASKGGLLPKSGVISLVTKKIQKTQEDSPLLDVDE